MSLDIIKEQRIIRTLFYSVIQSAELLKDNKELSSKFVTIISKFIHERSLIDEGTRDVKEVILELLEVLGWKSTKIDLNLDKEEGKIFLGKNRYIAKEIADSEGTLLVLRAFLEGLCYVIFNAPVQANVSLSLSAESQYNVTFLKVKSKEPQIKEIISATPKEAFDRSVHESFAVESIFYPIFTRELPMFILFEVLWKVITESYIANYTAEEEEIKTALKNPTMDNLSFIMLKLTENESEGDIQNTAEIIGEFFVKLLKTKTTGQLFDFLQTTIRDKHATSYLIYYECRQFCADRKFVNRCTFIRGLWIGILSEIFGLQLKVKELLHAGKRDSYCMLELTVKKDN
ncbi:MAG: hypothetical protein JXA54_07295 [Candidatus Heimdallarchaeota archaeon]|nr:hypothetical protein [Candidatus Heimdallarchaeota archaeon]